ncbi:ParA family protein [Streptosporangium sp. CA-115845]|uniref:ParA family protein n=1 Tax=Streptosporangium sp. CA-115845 TaxID=3240071 RepID=UPI003D8D3833
MPIKIAFFNNKGGVSKTTTCFNLGWMLAERGHRVIVVDADPQCNLTGMVLDVGEEGALDRFYAEHPGRNLKEALEPAFKSRPVPLKAVECVEVDQRPGMFLIPGHVALAEDETSLGIAQQLSESVQGLRNLPGSFTHLFNLTAKAYEADVVLLDLSPGLGAINQNLVATADYVLVPCSPDIFSVMAIESLSRVIPRWSNWAKRAAELEALSDADYPFPAPDLKFLGVLVQRFRLRGGRATQAFQKYFDKLDESVKTVLVPALRRSGVMLSDDAYESVGMTGTYIISEISDFNTLIANSQQLRKPVFTLSAKEINRGGQSGATAEGNIATFRQNFEDLAHRVEILAGLRQS